MPVASADARHEHAIDKRPLPFRLRTVLLLAVLAYAGHALYPRAKAAWQLHSAATTFANYGLCMAGPTGPSLLRDDPNQFWRLVRRRLVGAAPGDRPFAECAKAASDLTQLADIERAHRATASSFVEFGGRAARLAAAGDAAALSLADLGVSIELVADVSRRAWPFVRGGYTRLIKPSIGAHEAIHPVQPPTPAVGSGLPGWHARYRVAHQHGNHWLVAIGKGENLSYHRSGDGGARFEPTRSVPAVMRQLAERCPIGADGRSYVFGANDDITATTLGSLGPDAAPFVTELAPAHSRIVAAACDSDALVVALVPSQPEARTASDVRRVSAGVAAGATPRRTPLPAELRLCPYRRPCRALSPPPDADGGLTFPVDVARIAGTTIVATTAHGIVRVASTRDDGGTWTPFSVAFDAAELAEDEPPLAPPGRLLALGQRLLLYGGARRHDQQYFVLVSDDQGASFRAP